MNKAGWDASNSREWDELNSKVNQLEAALSISRDGERIAKERLSAVSEELVAAHKENEILQDEITRVQSQLHIFQLRECPEDF